MGMLESRTEEVVVRQAVRIQMFRVATLISAFIATEPFSSVTLIAVPFLRHFDMPQRR